MLPVLSKILERIIHKEMSLHVDNFLSPYLCGDRKVHKYATSTSISNRKIFWTKTGCGRAELIDLSKAFDTLNHDLLIAKLHAYGFTTASLKLIKSSLTNH